MNRDERDAQFTAFADEASGSLTGTAWLLTGDRDDAQELVQAALVKTYLAWPRVRKDDALAYARRCLVNENIDRWRKRRPESLVDDWEASGVTPSHPSAEVLTDTHDEIVRALATLPPQQRTVIVLRYFSDLGERQVAETLGISLGAVKSACSRGLASLRAAHPEGALS